MRSAVSSASAFSCPRPVPRPVGMTSVAMSAMMIITPMVSMRVKPARGSALGIGDVRRDAGPALAPVGPERDDLVVDALDGRPVLVGVAPGVERHFRALEIGAVPGLDGRRALDEGFEAFG